MKKIDKKKKRKYLVLLLIILLPLTVVFSFAYIQYSGFAPLVGGSLEAPVLSLRTPDPSIDGDVTIEWKRTIEFSWVNSYYIYRSVNDGSWIEIDEVGSSASAYNDFGLSNNDYRYKVIGKEYGINTAYSNIVSVSVEIEFVPSIPIATTISLIIPNPNTNGIVDVKFMIGIPDAIGYDIYRSMNGGIYVFHWNVLALDNQVIIHTFHDSNVVDGNAYSYKIITKGIYGDSGFSNIESVLISIYVPPPNAPVLNPITYIDYDGNIYMTWTSLDAITYDLYRSKDNSIFTMIVTTSQEYYNDNGLSDGVYIYKLKSINKYGVSDFSNSRTVTVQIPTVPDFPILSSFNPSIDNDGIVNVQWLGVVGVKSYDLYRSIDGGNYIVIKNTYLTYFIDKDLDDGLYSYKLKAKNDVGSSDFSNIEIVVVELPIPLQPPEGISSLSAVSSIVSIDGNNEMEWTTILHATSYDLYRSKEGSSYALIKTTDLTSYTDSGLSDGWYNYYVKGKNIDGESDISNVLYFRVEIIESIPEPIPEPTTNINNTSRILAAIIIGTSILVIVVIFIRKKK